MFQSETNEGTSIALNSNNKIIIVSENTSKWSQKFNITNKNVIPLQVVNNGAATMIESNSDDVVDEAEGTLDADNVMLASEDSSEWSQDLITIKRKPSSSNVNNTNEASMEENDTHGNNTEEADSMNVNYTATENNSEMSNSVPDPLDGARAGKNVPTEELLEGNLLRCRTCLCIVDPQESSPLETLEDSGETLKELLIYLIPQMASTLCDEDIVCKQCDNNIKFCVEFIDNCIKVETELLNEYEDPMMEQYEEDSTEHDVKFKPTHTLDHDYMPEVKLEKESLMETEDSEMAENLLSNDDPTLASTEEYLFECFRCGQTFDNETALDNHSRVEHGILKGMNSGPENEEERIYYKCNLCEVLFATKGAYNTHVQTSHPEATTQNVRQMTYTCKYCGNKFFYLGDLFEHKRRVHGFTCDICPERFNKKNDLEKHLQTHPDLYFCEICNMGFKTRITLSDHVKLHDSPSMNPCPECGRNFKTQEELTEHLEQGDHPVETTVKTFLCCSCDVSFTDRKSLNKHRQVCHGYIKEYLCAICDKTFSSKTSLDSHYRLKHAEVKPFQCERCGERFARLDYLRRHNTCNAAAPCKKFMKGPRRKFRYTKADGEPVKCKLCGKVFKDVYLLKLHLTTHTNLRRFRCSVCNLTFTTNKNRERHEKIHDDPLSKYRCTVCWKRTQSQEELDSHILCHEKKYQCHVCHESFARVYLLNYHVSEEHADDEDVEKEKQIVFTEGLKEYLVDY